jgi:hypothetical protein
MRALVSAFVYFGTFLTIGYVAKRLLDKWMASHGEHLHEVRAQNRNGGGRQHDRFLLGTWYRDG